MIRILTLLVSLFTFGLVDLAEITYEIPVTDMLYFNDTPIEELNDLTLNEVFRDNNLYNLSYNLVSNYNVTLTINDDTTAIESNINNFMYYDMTNIYRDVDDTLYIRLKYNPNNSSPILKTVLTSINYTKISNYIYYYGIDNYLNGIDHLRFAWFNTGSVSFEVDIYTDDSFILNISDLGISSLTISQIDRYYELWQNPELNITYQINTLDTQDIVILIASQSVWTIMIHLLYKYAYRPKKKSKRLGM
jgi:hypothetical protein